MADKPKKFMQKESQREEKAGTKGSLRAAAGVSGGKKMSKADLDRMEAKAKSMKGSDGKMSPAGLKLFRKVQMARRFMSAKH